MNETEKTSEEKKVHSGDVTSDHDENAAVTNPAVESADPLSMEQAFQVLGLAANASPEIIDQRFYQLTKRFRIEKDAENLAKVTTAYEIASGRAARKEEAEKEHDAAPKYLGKTKKEWNTFFYYSWWKFAIAILAVLFIAYFANQLFQGNNYDVKIVNIGHFKTDYDCLTDFAVEDLKYRNPYVIGSDIGFADPTSNSADAMNESLAAYAFLSANPDVIIFDEPTMPYFVEYLENMDTYYESLRLALTPEQFATIEPVKYTLLDSYKLRKLSPDDYELTDEIKETHIYGLRFTDPKIFQALGFQTHWDNGDKNVVISLSASSENPETAESFVADLIKNQDVLIQQFEQKNGKITVLTEENTKTTVTEKAS